MQHATEQPPRLCEWTLRAALRGRVFDSARAEFTLHGYIAARCARVVRQVLEQEEGVGCGLSSAAGIRYEGTMRSYFSQDVVDGVEKKGAPTRTIGFVVGCDVDFATAGSNQNLERAHANISKGTADLEALEAYLRHLPKSALAAASKSTRHADFLTLRSPLSWPTGRLPVNASRVHAADRRRGGPGCAVRACSKVYGNGGILAVPGYLDFWVEHLRSMGVAEIVIYALEPLSAALASQLSRHPEVITLRQWGSRPFTATELRAQRESYSGEIESLFMSSTWHCAHDAVGGGVDFALNIDVDESLRVGGEA
jgi:hypothetical protein